MLWNAIRTAIASEIPASEFDLWIKPIVCAHEHDTGMTLAGPDRFFCSWVEKHYLNLIRQKSVEAGGSDCIRLQVDTGATEQGPVLGAPIRQQRLPGVAQGALQLRSLHPAFTFEQFMVGESNRLAQTVCKALAENDYTFGRCLFMESGTGLGKSHLTQAVVHQVLRKAPATRLHYLTAQQFSAEMVKGLRTKSMDQFSRKYIDDCDMLLLEDVHTLTGRDKTQEELNIVLDYLLKSGRRVILTSALAPDKIAGLDADFRSRMAAGLMASIQTPDFDTRTRIIRHKMAAQGLVVHDDLVEYMAEGLAGDIRRMESAIMSVKAKSCLRQAPPDMAMIREVLLQIVGAGLSAPTADMIRDCVSSRFKVSREELRSRSRKRNIVFPRQIAMYLTRKFTEHSLNEIGEMYSRDHSTVLHSIKTITQRMVRETSVREQVDLLVHTLEKRK